MAIVLTSGRPAIDIVQDSYTPPEGIWESVLGRIDVRSRLQVAIAGVGRLDSVDDPRVEFWGTAFAVGRDLLLTWNAMERFTKPDGDAFVFLPGVSGTPQTPLVDFRRELIPSDPIRARIEQVLYRDPVTRVELSRAKLPEHIVPLRLSVRSPAELVDRSVAVIGYAARDGRNEPDALQQIFRGVYNVKRLLPGRIISTKPYQHLPNEFITLVHDCTTLGGCGGAPLVDLETGEVLGIQFAGTYLQENYAVSAWELASNPRFQELGVDFSGMPPRSLPPRSRVSAISNEAKESLEAGVLRLTPPAEVREPMTDLEAMVLSAGRPLFPVEMGRPQVDGLWKNLLKPHEPRLTAAIRAVGRIIVDGAPGINSGTGFVVGERLVMTASACVQDFAIGMGASVQIRPGVSASIDFSETLGFRSPEASARISRVRFVHPYFQVALLEIDRTPAGVAALDLSAQMPSDLAGRVVILLGFVDEPDEEGDKELFNKIFGTVDGQLRLLPGRAVQMSQAADRPPALISDYLSLGRVSGGPVLDLDTGYVIGVHTSAVYLRGSFSQPVWELARDFRVLEHPIRFRPEARPPWLDMWDQPQPVSTSPALKSKKKPERWSVDEVPIDWQLDPPKKLRKLLADTVDPDRAIRLSEDVGLRIGAISKASPINFWWDLLKKASTAAVLRPLIEAIAEDPEFRAIAPGLKEFL